MKNKYKFLGINDVILNKEQLELHMKKIASNHILKLKSDRGTYPIFRLKDNLEFIEDVYDILNEDIKNGISIHPAGEWLLDNYYVIEKNAKNIIKNLNTKKYINLIGISNGQYKGYARAYIVANEIISYTDGKIDGTILEDLLRAYQSKKTLSMEELWNVITFLLISLIEKIRIICEKIYLSQMQKRKVESIICRLVEFNEDKKIKIKMKNRAIDFSDSKYPFIEYMSYRLKQYGKKTSNYLSILEEQVNRNGNTIEECINREHFDIAAKKVSIGNCISSINMLNRLNFIEIFDRVNGVEDILRKDPANVYDKMDYETKEYYRGSIKIISKKTKISELYIVKKCLELSQNKTGKKSHIGYYIVDKGRKDLYKLLTNKKMKLRRRGILQLSFINLLFSVIISGLFGYRINLQINNWPLSIISYFLLIFIIKNIFGKINQFISGKIIKPKMIPKLDFINGVPEEYSTIVVVPCIIKNRARAKELFDKLEVYYHANKSDNIYFALLGDCTCEEKEKSIYDEEIINECIECCGKLNEKYKDEKYPKFNFIYRKRNWCECENSYLGWERKRGLLTQFNNYILGKEHNLFLYNSFEKNNKNIPKIKYIITLDSDTELTLNSGLKLIGAMAHILNTPEVDKSKNIISSGYGIIQPRIGINIDEANKSIFSKLFAGNSGVDSYTNAISDFYQDNYEEGIYTGKGIYDLEIFSKILENEIPENKVLSHDLLEGCYLRCGLATDIVLMDGYPSNYYGYRSRQHRWIRGDYQIIEWLFSKKINILSKFKIIDNLLRSLLDFFALILIFLGYVFNNKILIIIPFVAVVFSYMLNIFDKIIIKKNGQKKYKRFNSEMDGIKAIFIKAVFDIGLIPDRAFLGIDAACRSLYRLFVSKKHLLEWTTAEDYESHSKNGVIFYYKKMFTNVMAGIISLIIGFVNFNVLALFLGTIWLIFPAVIKYVSDPISRKNVYERLDKSDKEYVYEIGKSTWQFFKDFLNEKNNYLPPDNYQEDRKNKIVYRTSPTNIGLALMSIISSYDLNLECEEYTISLIEKMLNTIDKLPKWNGHLFNWYNIQSLDPLYPKYVSSVDSGNFVGYLYVLKQFLNEIKNKNERVKESLFIVNKLIDNTDYSKLYDYKNGLFSIGFNCEENKMTDSYYDLLASEARQTSFIAIAKKDVPTKHWKNLGRTLTTLNKHKGLISWSGTAFEYLMPTINIKRYPGSLLDESCKFMIMSQIEYSKKLGIPWGISEAAFNLKDFNGNYQYKAFGIPWLGLKRGLADEIVISSYGTILAINDEPEMVISNLKELEKIGMNNKYGFYESVDYTPGRTHKNKKSEVVKTYMAHHQGLILLSINNLINDNILQDRFSKNPEIKSVDILLQEKIPENIVVTKEKKEHIDRIKSTECDYYMERKYDNSREKNNKYNYISNNKYSVLIDKNGNGYSKYNQIFINRYKKTDVRPGGIMVYLKNKNDIWSPIDDVNNKIIFYPDRNDFINEHDKLKTTTSMFVSTESPIEIRNINIKNLGNESVELELFSIFEPVLSDIREDYAHKAFNKLFLSFEKIDNIVVVKRNLKNNNEKIYMATTLVGDDGDISYDYDLDKLNVCGRNNYNIPNAIIEGKRFSNSTKCNTNQVVAFKKKIKLNANEEKNIFLLIGISNNKQSVIEIVKKYCNYDNVVRAMKLSRVQTEANIQYLGLTGKDVNLSERILSQMLNNCGKQYDKKYKYMNLSKNNLWKYGISGEKPILLFLINEIIEMDILKKMIKCYEYLRHLNYEMDLIIINNKVESYENYVQEAINNIIWNNYETSNNIFVLNNISENEKMVLKSRANLVIDGKYGNIEYQLDELDQKKCNQLTMYLHSYNEKNFKNNNDSLNKKIYLNNAKIYNGYGGFFDDSYLMKINKNKTTPVAWSHILSNEKFGTIVTENMGGYTWYQNSRLNRITTWSNDSIEDLQSELFYIIDENNSCSWNASIGPASDEEDYCVKYEMGLAEYKHFIDDIEQSVKVFVPKVDACKINIISLKNLLPQKRKIKIVYYMRLALDEDEINSYKYLYYENEKVDNYILIKNLANSEFNYWMYISSSEQINNIEKNFNIIKCEINVEISEYEEKNISIFFGCENVENNCNVYVKKYQVLDNCFDALDEVKNYWKDFTNKINILTPVESVNLTCNGWIIYQVYCSRILAKSGYYQSGGAWGFRDQLQDSMCLKYFDLDMEKNQIIRCCSHQFIEGDVLHWWHDDTGRGIRTKFSDDLLWLPYVVYDYIEYSGDYSILDINVPYLYGEKLLNNIDEKYDFFEQSQKIENIYMHCIRAIDKSLNFGEHGIPKIGSGDWNDGFNYVGNNGKGESVWLAFFLYDILNKFTKICEYKLDLERKNEYEKIANKLKNNVNSNCWDGGWFKRAFCDDGNVIGSCKNQECKIDSISQSWSIISKCAEKEKNNVVMDNIEKYLVDKENGIIKLLDPPFEKGKINPGYIKSYLSRDKGKWRTIHTWCNMDCNCRNFTW